MLPFILFCWSNEQPIDNTHKSLLTVIFQEKPLSMESVKIVSQKCIRCSGIQKKSVEICFFYKVCFQKLTEEFLLNAFLEIS